LLGPGIHQLFSWDCFSITSGSTKLSYYPSTFKLVNIKKWQVEATLWGGFGLEF